MHRPAFAGCLALLVLTVAAPGQEGGGAPPPAPPAPAPPPPTPAPPATPPATPPRPGSVPHDASGEGTATGPVALPHMAPTLPVTGLKPENAEQVAERLEGFVDLLYVCSECGAADFEPGTCCDQERAASRAPSIASAAANPAGGSISFIVAPGRRVRLSDFERLLAPLHVDVQHDKLKAPVGVTLRVEGLPADPEGTTLLRAALTAPDLLEEFDVARSGSDRATLVVRRVTAAAPTLARIGEALAAADPPLRLADVDWSSAPRG